MNPLLIASAKASSGSSGSSGSSTTDPNFNNVALLLHGQGANGSANNVYQAQNTLTLSPTGSVGEGTFTPYGSNWSNNFDGSTGYLTYAITSAATTFGTGDFTAECWFNMSSAATNQYLIEARNSSNTTSWGVCMGPNGSGGEIGYYANGVIYQSSFIPSTGIWYHMALVRHSGSVNLYINGTSVLTETDSSSWIGSTSLTLGVRYTSTNYFPGNISNVRIVNGTAMYTASFTPSTAPLTAVTGTSLLTSQSNTFKDNSTNKFAATVTGTVKVQRFNPFGDAGTPYSTATYGGSTWFDGSTGYLTGSAGLASSLAFGANSFTVEAWVYAIGSSTMWITETRNSSATGGWVFFLGGTDVAWNNGTTNVFSIANVVTPNTWNHVAYSRNGTTGNLFVNGVLAHTLSDTNSYTTSDIYVANGYNLSSFSNGYITDLRIVNGTALYTANFTPNTTPLQTVANTVLLMNGTDSSKSGAFDNAMQQEVIFTGNAAISSAQSKFGGSSLSFNGATTTGVTIPNTQIPPWGASNWTIEAWIYPTAASQSAMLLSHRLNVSVYGPIVIWLESGVLALYATTTGSSWNIGASGGTPSANTWSHIAVVRNGNTFTMYLNGTAVANTSASGALSSTTYPFVIGSGATSGYQFSGYMQDVRITSGVARYTTTFTPPTTALPNSITTDSYFNNVSLLIHGNGTNGYTNNIFSGGSTTSTALAVTGNVAEGTFSPYGSNWSNYFNGSTGYLTFPTATGMQFGSNSFTIEAWINLNSLPASGSSNTLDIFQKGYAGGSNLEFWWSIGQTSGAYQFVFGQSTTGSNFNQYYSSNIPIATNTWYHVAICKSGSTVYYWLNGVQYGYSSVTATTWSSSGIPAIGSNSQGVAPLFPGYISNLRVNIGNALYTSSFTPSTSPLTAISGTTLLTCQSNSFVDNSSNSYSVTVNGAPTVTRLNPFGDNKTPYATSTYGGSCWFDGSTGYLSSTNTSLLSSLAIGTNSYTVEAWVYLTSYNSGGSAIIDTRNSSITNGFALYVLNSETLNFAYSTSAFVAGGTVHLYAWTHVAYSRNNGTGTLFINGKTITSLTDTTNIASSTIKIGANTNGSSTSVLPGYLADLRVVNGSAVYSTNFTPNTAPLTAITNTVFLYNATDAGTSGIYDNAMQQNIETYGAASISTAQQKFGTGSVYFNGASGAYLTVANSQLPAWGAANWTIEFWVYPTVAGQTIYLLSHKTSASTSNGPIALWLNGGAFSLVASTTGSGYTTSIGAAGTVPANAWTHLAVVRNGSTVTLYQGGAAVATGTISGALCTAPAPLTIGSAGAASGYTFTGYMQDLRISYGTARYLTNFTVPSAAFPNQ
jgi:hypothetical protein